MVYAVPLIVFMDNILGNVSKQWNKHYVVYTVCRTLCYCGRCWSRNSPFSLYQLCHIHLQWISCKGSNIPLSVFSLICIFSHLQHSFTRKATDSGIVTFDIKHQEEVMLIPHHLIVVSNNPMKAEECSHDGLRCNCFCCTCKDSGTTTEKKKDKGYRNIFQICDLIPHQTRLTPFVT